MSEKTAGNGSEKTTLNLSVTVEDKRFLKVYAAQNGTTISGLLKDYIETLKHSQDDGTKMYEDERNN
jgi:hypothetical protein